MRIAGSIIALLMAGVLVVPSDCSEPSWFDRYVSSPIRTAGDFVSGAYHGAGDMWRSYSDLREANFKTPGTDKYFHARGNFDAAQRGSGGRWAARVISDAREGYQGTLSGHGPEDTQADQEANRWGRNGGDPNRYRPAGLPDRY
ncbi:serum amyloid A-5 protein isoform X2 [Strongylocentrotus purpuratus]|uniref:Serum amyloid A protein n=1 Tax=Strongylocentrotus purpuratus TaxID=7668 RepID=A0A7M7NJ22_STRPU|nr:serum amyloid A-5 protein isoform X2 [Strongylocentrotus purpuratus]